MQALAMYQVDAFAERPFEGNPAAVLVVDRPLDDRLMQAIAAENNLAETAYVWRDGADWQIRWFTPTHEAAFCGHATLAAAHVLHSAYGVRMPVRFGTGKVGVLAVGREPDGRYALDLPRLDPAPLDPPPGFAGIFPDGWMSLFRNFENYFAELASPEAVAAFRPDLTAIARFGEIGLCITARGGRTHAGAPVDFVSRYFWPGGGIDEDPVTGSTHATLVPYWAARLGKDTLSAFQASRRGGALTARLGEARVVLTAAAATFMKATIYPA
jgi:predicted PhzF superfamily epimerase YddE/YHI9